MNWDLECDVLVAGSGGGGLTGAYTAAVHGLDTLLIESTDRFGGTTCYSGGAVWLPGNQASARDGLDDDTDTALAYFQAVVGTRTPAELQRAFVRTGPRVVEMLERSQHLRFAWFAFPDYYGDIGCPPAHPRGRDILVPPLAREDAGRFAGLIRPQMPSDVAGVPAPDEFGGGAALVGRLLLAAEDAGVRLRTGCALEALIEKDGRVIGARVSTEAGELRVRARRGVLLAGGGFERDQAMRDTFGVAGSADWSCGAPGATGGAIRAGIAIGAATDLMEQCWWMPGLLQPEGRSGFIAAVNGGIIVNAAGERFGSESGPYDRFGRRMRAGDMGGVAHVPAWWIWDAALGRSLPSAAVSLPLLDPAAYEEAGLWFQADTLVGLAGQIGVSADGLARTVARFNRFCETGIDEDFHRGETPYELYIAREISALMGRDPPDPVGSPNPCLIPIRSGPFHAATVVLGDLGTKGGLRTDARARVLREDGSVIAGLYAAGNSMAAVSGNHYPAPGTPIASSMVFAFLAAEDMVDANAARDRARVTSGIDSAL